MFFVFFIVSLWKFVLWKYANLEGALQTAKITNREKRKRQIPRKKAAREKNPFYSMCTFWEGDSQKLEQHHLSFYML